MEKLLNKKYRVLITGITDKVNPELSYTSASSEQAALRNVVFKIVREVQNPASPHNDNWRYRDGKFNVLMSPRYGALLYEYLRVNPRLYKVEEIR